MTKRSLKEKEILFPGSYDNVKINESTKAFRLIDDQCSWVTINLTAPTTSTRYLKRIPSLLEHLRHHRRAGHSSMSARARGAPPCKKYNLERGNRPSIQLPTPSPIISFITWMLHGKFGFETLCRYESYYEHYDGHFEERQEKCFIVKLSLITDSRYIKFWSNHLELMTMIFLLILTVEVKRTGL